MIPDVVIQLAYEAESYGATAVIRSCVWSDHHVDIFNAPYEMGKDLRAAGFEPGHFRRGHWRWCEEKTTTPPPPP